MKTKGMKFKAIFGFVLCLGLLLFSAPFPSGGGADQVDFPNIYIDASAGDGGVGSQADPYNEFSDINWTTGGDNSVYDGVAGGEDVHIYLKRGGEWREEFSTGADGTAAHPILVSAYGTGASPIINCSDLVSTWTETSGDIDVGGDGGDRGSATVGGYSYVGTYNPANNSGTINKIELYLGGNASGVTLKAGVFENTAGTNYKCRSIVNLTLTGSVGDKLTFNAPADFTAFNVSSGDVVGLYCTVATAIIKRSSTGTGLGSMKYLSGDKTDGGTYDFSASAVADLAISMTGSSSIANVWQATLMTEPNQVFFNGTKGGEQVSIAACNGANKWYWDSNTLYAYSTSDPDTAYIAPGIEASVRDYGIDVGHEYVEFSQIRVTKAAVKNARVYRSNTLNIDSLVTDDGTLIEGFQTTGDWSLTGTGAAVSEDAVHYTNGTKSIKLSGDSGTVTMTKTVSLDLSGDGGFLLGLYLKDSIDTNTYLNIQVSSTTDFSKYKTATLFSPIGSHSNPDDHIHRYLFNKSHFSDSGGESWDNTMIRIKFSVWIGGGGAPDLTFTDLYFGYQAKAVCLISFDDGYKKIIDNAYPVLKGNGQAATFFVIKGWVEDANADHIDEDDCDTLYANGWDIATHGDADWTAYDATDWTNNVEAVRLWIIASGWPRGAPFAAYPAGTYDDTVLDRMQTNFFLGRTVDSAGYQMHPVGLDEDYWFIHAFSINATPATNQGYVDNAIASGGLLVFLNHLVGPGESITTDTFTALSNYLKAQEDNILTLTFSEYLAARGLAGIKFSYCIFEDGYQSGISIEYAGNHKLYNNVFARNGYGLEMAYNKASLAPEIKNNVFWDNGDDSYQIYSRDTAISADHIMDYNLYYDPDAHTNVLYWEGTARATLAAFVAATTYEDNGVESDPLFTAGATSDFTLQSTSPCIDAGTDVGLNSDYTGNPVPSGGGVDIGAYELQVTGAIFIGFNW